MTGKGLTGLGSWGPIGRAYEEQMAKKMKEGIISFKPKPRNTSKQQIAEGLKSPGFVAIAKSLSTANAQATGAKPPSKNVINDSIFSSPKPKQ